MSDSETVSLEIRASVAETMRRAGARDERLGAEIASRAARLAVDAWAMAVDGDDTALAAIAQPDAAHWLLHPVGKPWQVARGPRVTKIEIWDLEAEAEPPRLRVSFEFAWHRRFADPDQADEDETTFVALLDLVLQDGWRLSSGRVWTLDEYLGYVFTSRRETAEEYRKRTGSAPGPGRRFRIVAGFAEHDERLGSTAVIEVARETAPDRDEAVRLVWPAVEAETARVLGDGDWRPSLNWLDVIELLSGE